MKEFNLEDDLKRLDYFFVSNDMKASTALMKCELPANALSIIGVNKSSHISVSLFEKLSSEGVFNERSVIIFLKVGNNLSSSTMQAIERIKGDVFAMFCDVNDNYQYFLEELRDNLSLDNLKNASKFFGLMDGILYESTDMKSVIEDHDENLVPLRIRHPHTNCTKSLNPFSLFDNADPAFQFFKPLSSFHPDGILNFGYMGRPKHCTDYLRITRAIYNLEVPARFIQSHPNRITNMSLTAELDVGFSLYGIDDWTRRLKPANKIMNYWSLGIPCLMTANTAYRDVFHENNLDFSIYEIPDIDFTQYPDESRYNISLTESNILTEKIRDVLNPAHSRTAAPSSGFHERREELWYVSKRYNPMNMKFLYEGMFDYIKARL